MAREFALGDFVQAAKANDEIASQFFRSNLFFRGAQIVYRYYYWLNLIWVMPANLWTIAARATTTEQITTRVWSIDITAEGDTNI